MLISAVMLPSTCVVVPTYWSRAGGASCAGDAVYDHPTAVDAPSTLDALLESLEKLDTRTFYLLILVAVTGADVARDAEARVRDLVAGYPGVTSLVFGPSTLQVLRERLNGEAGEDRTSFLDLARYPKIRNLQLAIPLTLGSQAIVALDDDEIVTDSAFLRKATEPLGTSIDGRVVDGLSGYYLQDDGGILLRIDPDKSRSPNIFDRKASIMNAATEMLQRDPGDIVLTPFCFGGNMEFTPELAASVGFDPQITRGEDIDYLINARLEGKNIFMRKDLRILHRPPAGGSYQDASWSKLEQDVMRFTYEREKLLISQTVPDLRPLTVEELMPYPGEFLSDNHEEDAREALSAARYPEDIDGFLRHTTETAREKIDEYLRFRTSWPNVTARLRDDAGLRDKLLSRMRGV
ncbi:MAG: hypothetical protein ACR2JC_15375 [Chloroflexota bacterium]